MKKQYFFSLLVLSMFSRFALLSRRIVLKGQQSDITRNPDSCYRCDASHIMTYHNENILSH